MTDFRSGQILYLEHQNARLYAEAIQVIEERDMCWVRPIVLVAAPGEPPESTPDLPSANSEAGIQTGQPTLYDLRQGSDLLCPACLFTAALDTDLLPILAALDRLKSSPIDDRTASTTGRSLHFHLQNFIQALWQAHPDAFYP